MISKSIILSCVKKIAYDIINAQLNIGGKYEIISSRKCKN